MAISDIVNRMAEVVVTSMRSITVTAINAITTNLIGETGQRAMS